MAATQSRAAAAAVKDSVRTDTQAATSGPPTSAARGAAFTQKASPQQLSPFEVEVKGQIPKWLKGYFVRNGPGHFAPEMTHLFDGYAMLTRFDFEDGKVHSMQRYIDSNAWQEFQRTGKMQFAEFGTPLPPFQNVTTIFKGLLGFGDDFTDNANVSTMTHPDGKSLLAMTEVVNGTYKVDIASLATEHRYKFEDDVKGVLTTAHPAIYPDGRVVNLAIDLGRSRQLFSLDVATNTRTTICDVPMANPLKPSWSHDFPATQNYVVIPDTPAVFSPKALMVGGAPYVVFDWQPELGTMLHVVSLRDGSLKTFPAPAYFTFHYANAFETADGNQICFDFAQNENPELVNGLKLDNMRGLLRPLDYGHFTRCTITLDGSQPVQMRKLLPNDNNFPFSELPRTNPLYKFKEYRYAYAVSAVQPTSCGNALAKMDIERGLSKQWFEPGCITGEPLMIPRPGAEVEDDGVVISLITGADGRSFLLVLDAETFEETGRAQLPYGVPYSFHGTFIPKE